MFGKKVLVLAVLMILTVVFLTPAVVPKKAQSTLDDLVMASSRLRVPQNIETIDNLRASRPRVEALNPADAELLKNFDRLAEGWDQFLTFTGGQWQMLVDTRTGLPALVEGSGEPWIPGAGNNLRAEAFGDITVSRMESIARDFMLRNPNLFPISQNDLVLVPEGTIEVGEYFWHIQFQFVKNGIPVEGARVVFRVNNGNLIQFGFENVNPNINIDTIPSFEKETAWEILGGYIGGWEENDVLLETGRLLIVPTAPFGDDGTFRGTIGSGSEYHLVYEVVFQREGVMGTWKARIDAHTGEILSFVDQNMYGSVTGGIYPNSNLDTEVIRPFPKVTVTNSTTKTCDMGGNYTYSSGTATASLKGAYVTVSDSCGTSSLSTSTAPGDLSFSKSSGTDCTTPGVGGSGNTHAARSTYFHLTLWKERALGFLPSNSWLSSALTDKVNLSQTCNAYWSGSYVAFFKSGGGCSNTGELPTIFLHEVGHGLDSNDGSGYSSVGSSESYADSNALLQTHDSCIGTNFIPGYKCSGYGDACTTCTGIRDADYAKHTSNIPAKPSQLGNSSGFHCSLNSSYPGPCGYEGHCESYIMSEVVWDLAARDLPSSGLSANTAWYVADRLFFLSRASSTEAYSCPSITSTNGCGTGNWFTTFRAIDDDDGNLTNGTPHGGAIYNAFSRHITACTSVSGYNVTYSPYTTPSKPTLTATAGAGQVSLSWTTSTGASKYTVLRNEMGSNYGMMVIATQTGTTYTDTQVAPGITYYYAIAPVGTSNSTIGTLSDVKSATPTSGGTTTYSISGTITLNGSGLSGVTVTAGSATATTGTTGAYTITGLTNGTYTVTPSKSGYTFSPANYSVTINGANVTGKNFTATAATTYSISGTVTYNSSGLSGVTMTLSGAASATTSTATDGTYTFSGLANGTYTVTPSKSGYTFSPTSTSVTISGANQTGKNFTATVSGGGDVPLTSGVGVSGSVAESAYVYYTIYVPSGATNLTVRLTGLSADIDLYDKAPSTAGGTATHPTTSTYTGRSWNSGTTSESLSHSSPTYGTWSIAAYGYEAGSYTVTATVTTGTTTYSISGTITLNGSGLSGVTVTAGSATATTGTTGAYTISGLANGTYTVTPSKRGYTFSPTNYSVTISGANVTGKNFTAAASGGGDIVLSSGVGANGSVSQGAWGYYTIYVPSGATNLTVTLTNLTADVDLYDKAPSSAGGTATHPTTSTYTGRSWNSGTTSESLSHSSPTYGTWSIGAYGYEAGSYTVTATVTTGTTTYSISGTITLNGSGLSGVTVTAGSSTATTGTTGAYTITGLANGTYTVTPSKSGYTFSPANYSVTISGANVTGKNFTATSSGGGTTTNALTSPGFESSTGWTWTYSGASHTWRTTVSTPVTAHGGSYKAQLCSYSSTYYHNQTEYLKQTVTIPSTATSAKLNFWYYIKTAETTTSTAYDKLTVYVTNTSGTTLKTLVTLSNLNKTSAWTQKTNYDLSAYKGQTIVLIFKGTTDSSLGTMFLLDDIELNVTQ